MNDRHAEIALSPLYTRGERVADGVVHLLGLTASLIAASLLIGLTAADGDAARIASASAYGAAMVAVFAFSASYNMLSRPGLMKEVLRRCDHAAIYFKIAGTYTPFAAVSLAGAAGGVGRSLLIGVWTAALAGAALKIAAPRRFEALSIALYLGLGWSILAVLGPVMEHVSQPALILLLAGGVLYSAGVAFHLWRSLPYQNAIWHGFVLAASACHFAAVAIELL
jgi:hemolysin III